MKIVLKVMWRDARGRQQEKVIEDVVPRKLETADLRLLFALEGTLNQFFPSARFHLDLQEPTDGADS